jgi:hypothetical protein
MAGIETLRNKAAVAKFASFQWRLMRGARYAGTKSWFKGNF